MNKGDTRGRGPPYFLTPDEHRLVEALVETVLPGGDGPHPDPGGRDVGAHNYFDSRMLDLPEPARKEFRSTLGLVNERSKERFGRHFTSLAADERRTLLRSLLSDPSTMAQIFALRAVCLEGFYSDYHDPSYSGRTAWDLLEFKGKRIDGIKKDWSFLRIYRREDGGG